MGQLDGFKLSNFCRSSVRSTTDACILLTAESIERSLHERKDKTDFYLEPLHVVCGMEGIFYLELQIRILCG